MKDQTKGLLFALTTMFLWGFLAIALKIAVGQLSPYTIVWLRFTIAFIGLFSYFLLADRSQLKILIKPPPKLIIGALALGLNYIGFMWGIQYTSPSSAQVVIQTGPIMLAIAGVVLFKERVKRIQLLGFTVVIAGFSLFYSQQLQNILVNPAVFNKGILLTFMGAAAWTLYAIMQKYLVKKHPAQSLNLFLFALPAILYLPLVNFSDFSGLSWKWWALIIFLGLNTLLAYGGMSGALKYLDANKVSTVIVLNPTITFTAMAIFSWQEVQWIPHENFPTLVWVGAVLFISGAILVIRSGRKK